MRTPAPQLLKDAISDSVFPSSFWQSPCAGRGGVPMLMVTVLHLGWGQSSPTTWFSQGFSHWPPLPIQPHRSSGPLSAAMAASCCFSSSGEPPPNPKQDIPESASPVLILSRPYPVSCADPESCPDSESCSDLMSCPDPES